MSRSKVALVDADGLLYLAGFGVQKALYQVVLEDGKGELDTVWFPSAKEIKVFLSENPDLSEVGREKHIEVGPLEHALQIAKSKLQDIQRLYGNRMEVYIRGDNQKNFRNDIATLWPYKGNRSQEKPEHFEAIRQYLIEHWNAYKVERHEVDDEIGCRMSEIQSSHYYEPIVVSPDKDLDQLPGEHYNYKSNVQYYVDEDEARRWFWMQVLTGDYSDNVRGCWGVGEKGAAQYIDDILHLDDEEVWSIVVAKYANSMEIEGCPYVGMDPELVALENAQLVYMRRERGEIWTPPGVAPIFEQEEVRLDD